MRFLVIATFVLLIASLLPVASASEEGNDPQNCYELIPTPNDWNFLLLNHCTGEVQQVTYSIDTESKRQGVMPVTSTTPVPDGTRLGRFRLVMAGSLYQFLLLDKETGIVRLGQWHNEEASRGVVMLTGKTF